LQHCQEIEVVRAHTLHLQVMHRNLLV